MNFHKFDLRLKQYSLTSAAALVLWQFGLLLRNTPLKTSYFFRNILSIFPNFALSVAVPFGILAVLRLFKFRYSEVRVFYLIIYILFFMAILTEALIFKYIGTSFDIFDIVASGIAFYFDMILHSRFESIYIKKEQDRYKNGFHL